jgi:hypothetical protein
VSFSYCCGQIESLSIFEQEIVEHSCCDEPEESGCCEEKQIDNSLKYFDLAVEQAIEIQHLPFIRTIANDRCIDLLRSSKYWSRIKSRPPPVEFDHQVAYQSFLC